MRLQQVRRQWGVIQLLRAWGGVSLGRLARELQVTTRTVRRDLEALEALHVPIVVEAGEDGVKRWRLIRGAPCPCCGHTRNRTATER